MRNESLVVPQETHSGNRPLRLLVEVGGGREASAILGNGFLQHCLDHGAEVHVLSPGALYQPFIERYWLPGVRFSYLSADTLSRIRHPRLVKSETAIGRRLCKHRCYRTRRLLWKLVGERLAASDAGPWREFLEEERPDCFVSLNLTLGLGRSINALCRRMGIPTLGNIFSWDHPFFTQQSRSDRITCWSPMMKDNLITIGGFRTEQIDITGAPAFDPYFDPAGVWTREELCDRLGLDPIRPILLYATLGQLRQRLDETGTFRAFMAALDREALPGPPQVILRLHPLSMDYYFEDFRSRGDVTFSRYVGYCPGMRWWPSRDEVTLAGNLLRHADVCISPGSTMTVEAAIFDTPTVIPVFNPTMPEEFDKYFSRDWLNRHFRFLAQEDRVPVVRSAEELMHAVRSALADPSWQSGGRKAIREHVLGPLDGRATERLANLAIESACKGRARAKPHQFLPSDPVGPS